MNSDANLSNQELALCPLREPRKRPPFPRYTSEYRSIVWPFGPENSIEYSCAQTIVV